MYKVYFTDGSEFIGGDPPDSKWNDMPDRAITRIQYSLFSLSFVFEGFEAYNHIIEKTVFLRPVQSGEKISKVVFMGRWRHQIYQIIFDLIKGKVSQKMETTNHKYTGWKKGFYDSSVLPKIRRS